MAVNVNIGDPERNRQHDNSMGAPSAGSSNSAQVLQAVRRSIEGDPVFVTDGVADLDALGAVSALNDRHRANAVNALRTIARDRRNRTLIEACADAIEKGPVKAAQAEVPVKAGPRKRTRRKGA